MWRSKYKAKKVFKNGEKFDSKKEASRWEQLQEMELQGMISGLERQVEFELIPKQPLKEPRISRGKSKRLIKSEQAVIYKADFVYMQDGVQIVEDVKGFCTPEYKIKRKLLKYLHGIEIKEV